MWKCNKCGQEFDESEKNCWACGASRYAKPIENTSSDRNRPIYIREVFNILKETEHDKNARKSLIMKWLSR